METLIAYFDGACEPVNPGGALGWGVVIFNGSERLFEVADKRPAAPTNTNNVAEYLGFLTILDWLETSAYFDNRVIIRGDSKLVINQMFGNWRIKAGAYADFARQAKRRLGRFSNVSGEWIPREQNTVCDDLSKSMIG